MSLRGRYILPQEKTLIEKSINDTNFEKLQGW